MLLHAWVSLILKQDEIKGKLRVIKIQKIKYYFAQTQSPFANSYFEEFQERIRT